jgi:iron complex transport system ATP-binding protein
MLTVNALTLSIGQQTLCRDFSETFSPGTWYTILGPNGCGKTQLLLALAGLRKPALSTLSIDDIPLSHFKPKARAKKIGILLQHFPEAISNQVKEAITSVMSESYDKRLEKTEKLLSLCDLNTLANRSIDTLSGGETQRVMIAMLLAQDPDTLLLDEPCNHLDIRHQVSLLNHLTSLKQTGKTIITVMHDLNLAYRYADHILLMLPDQIISNKKHIAMCEAQLSKLYNTPISRHDTEAHTIFLS